MQNQSFSISDLQELFSLPQKIHFLEQKFEALDRAREVDRQQILHLEQQVCDEKDKNNRLQKENQCLRCEREIDREFWRSRLERIEFMPVLDPEGEIRSIADLLDKRDED
jgi:hypothetical protein